MPRPPRLRGGTAPAVLAAAARRPRSGRPRRGRPGGPRRGRDPRLRASDGGSESASQEGARGQLAGAEGDCEGDGGDLPGGGRQHGGPRRSPRGDPIYGRRGAPRWLARPPPTPGAAPARMAAPGGRRGGPGGARAATPGAASMEPAPRYVHAKGELDWCPAVECVRERLGGQNGQFTRLSPHVRPLNLLIANR